MSKVLIVAIGSRGDLAPLTGLGAGLQRAGHDVMIAGYAVFADLVRGCGLTFRSIDDDLTDASQLADVNAAKALKTFLMPSGQQAMGEKVLAALRDEPADVLLLSPLAELAGHPLAEAKGIPAIGLRLQPLSATAAYPPAVLGAWSVGATGNRLAAEAGAWVLDRLYGRVVAGFRHQLGLPATSTRTARRARTAAQWPILYGYSPSVAPRPADWRPGLDVVGYWWPERPAGWQPPDEVVRFLEAGPAPVFVGFGSLINSKQQAEQLSALVQQAFRDAGVRGILQAGWAGLGIAGEDMLTIGDIPHDWLFPHVAAVAHHCGAGTVAAGLRAGAPAIAVPYLGDQPFWARRLHEVGVSAATISHRTLTADKLAAAIHTAVTDMKVRDNAQRIADRFGDEDGTAAVLATVDGLPTGPDPGR